MKYYNLITLKELLKLICIEDFVVFVDGKEITDFWKEEYIVENINSIPTIKYNKNKYTLNINRYNYDVVSQVVITARRITNETSSDDELINLL